MKPVNISRFLLPRPWRFVGLTLIALSVAFFAYVSITQGSRTGLVETFGVETFFVSLSLFQYHLPVIGLILIFISKEKVEDELSTRLRPQALIIGLLLTLIFSIFVFLIALVWWNSIIAQLSRSGLPFMLLVTVITYWVLKRRGASDEE